MRYLKAMMLGALLAALPVIPAGAATAGQRHDGTVSAVDRKSGTLTLDELGVGGRPQMLRVRVAPDTRVVLSERIPQATDAQHEFKDTPITLAAIHPGDFVVVDFPHGTTATPDLVMVTARASR
jgi:hypothetical protein